MELLRAWERSNRWFPIAIFLGLLLAPIGLGIMCGYPFMGALTKRFGIRKLSVGGASLGSIDYQTDYLTAATTFTTLIGILIIWPFGASSKSLWRYMTDVSIWQIQPWAEAQG
jgi:hypothetical protein